MDDRSPEPASDGVALVTGGGSGIGAALCRRLASRGTRVVVADIDSAAADRVAAEISGLGVAFDVAQRDAWDDAMATVADRLGPIARLALNAGTMIRPRGAPTDDDPLAWIDRRYETLRGVNVDGVVHGLMAALPALEETGGSVVVTASNAGLKPLELDPVYSMTKHAVIGLVRSLAGPLAGRGVRIGAVCPGGVDTPLVAPDLRGHDRTFAPPDHVAGVIEAVIEKPSSESGGIWITRGLDPVWRYEFRSPDEPPDGS
jgi:NAD(P)-dependent dehydrogenase (short-subunit alcohol dehydrogenase family)